MIVNQEKHDHEIMYLVTSSIPEDESLQLVVLVKHGENEIMSLINYNQGGGNIPIVSINSNKRVRENYYKSVKKG
jgi:hypothetical protein